MIRRLRNILLILLALGAAVVIGALVYLAYMGGIERLANDRLKEMFADRTNLDIHIGDIGGDFFSGFSLSEVEIFYVNADQRTRLAYIPKLQAGYSFANLWKRHYVLNYLYLDSLDLTLRYDTLTGWQTPHLTGGPDSTERQPRSLPSFAADNVKINAGRITVIYNGDTTIIDSIAFAAAVTGEEGTYGAELSRLAFTSNRPGLALDAAVGKVTYSESNLLFSDVIFSSGPSRIRAEGSVGFGDSATGTLHLDGDNIDVTGLSQYTGVNLKGLVDITGDLTFRGKAIEGSVNLAGDFFIFDFENLSVNFRYASRLIQLDSLYGSILDGCSIDGKGEIDFNQKPSHYLLAADVRNFNLDNLVNGTFKTDLTGHVDLDGRSFSGKNLVLNVDVDLFESTFHDFPIQQASGPMTITTDSLVFPDSFRVDYYENVFWATGRIDYRDEIDLLVQIDLNNLDRYRQTRFFIEEPGGRGYAEASLTGLTKDPDLRGWFASDSAWIYGLYADSMFATVDLERFLTGRQGGVEVWLDSGAAWGLPYDTARAQLVIDSNLVYADSLRMRNPYVTLTGTSVLDYLAEPQQLRILDLDIELLGRQFHNPDELLVEVDPEGFRFTHAEIGDAGSQLSLAGRINYDESMDLRLAIERLPVAPWLNLFDSTLPVDGYLSTDAKIDGTFREPEFTLAGQVDSLTYRGLKLGDVVAALRYRNQNLAIDSVRIYSGPGVYGATGTMSLDLALTADSVQRIPDRPMAIKMHAVDSRFDLVSLILPSVEELKGNFYADFELSGHPRKPQIDGIAYVKNAQLKYFDLANWIYTDSAGVTMHNDSIIVNRIEAYATEGNKPEGRRHYAFIDGSMNLLALDSLYYDLDIRLENEFPFTYELDDIRGKAEGELQVRGATPPTVTGDIELVSAQYRVPFADESSGSPLMLALFSENPWDLNINIDILSNYWVKNEDIDAEFAGEINLIRENGNYRFLGEMEILRGRGFLVDKTFRLEPGGRVIFTGSDTLNPQLDITGTSRVLAARASGDEGPVTEQVDLCIHVGGTLNKPEINPCEGSDVAQADILPLIVSNYRGGDGIGLGGQVEGRLFGLGYAQFSQIGGRQLNRIGVETFEIDPVYGESLDPWNAWVTLGKYVGEGLYLYGRSTLAGQTRQEYGFEYRWSKNLLMEGRRDEDELYHLNVRLHWEFGGDRKDDAAKDESKSEGDSQ